MYLSDVYDASCMTCSTDADCYNYYDLDPNATYSMGAIWQCMDQAIIYSDNTTDEVNLCIYNQCDTNNDCSTAFGSDYTCQTINCCDAEKKFYHNSTELYSTICLPSTTCDDISPNNTTALPDNQTVCYYIIYYIIYKQYIYL